MSMPLTLTFTPLLILADMYMFALSSDWLTTTGSYICRELSITASTSGGADAVRAIKGALVKARKPPSLEKHFRKSHPLRNQQKYMYVHTVLCIMCILQSCRRIPTNQKCSEPHQLQLLQGVFEKRDSRVPPSTEG